MTQPDYFSAADRNRALNLTQLGHDLRYLKGNLYTSISGYIDLPKLLQQRDVMRISVMTSVQASDSETCSSRVLILMRHATAYKNLEDRHGGLGSGLPKLSHDEVLRAIKHIPATPGVPYVLFCSPVPQARETAVIVAKTMRAELVEDRILKPLDLGVLSGLSRTEARSSYPAVAAQMERWRRGEIEINELGIPGAEDYAEFYSRGTMFLHSIEDFSTSALVVGTRSILILLASILLNRTIEPGGGYREIPFHNSEFVTFKRVERGWVLDPKLSYCTRDVLEYMNDD